LEVDYGSKGFVPYKIPVSLAFHAAYLLPSDGRWVDTEPPVQLLKGVIPGREDYQALWQLPSKPGPVLDHGLDVLRPVTL
jgi:hypothetical protein